MIMIVLDPLLASTFATTDGYGFTGPAFQLGEEPSAICR